MSKILYIKLDEKTFNCQEISKEVEKNFIGGRGLGAKLLFDLVNPEIEPLSEENKIIFTSGPLQGSGIPFSGRTQLVTKSPQTGTYLYSNAGGTMGINMNQCGFSAIVIEGKSHTPVFVEIINESVVFHDAAKYWGLTTTLAQKEISEDLLNYESSIAVIGPAGENLVKTACIVTGGEFSRTFGRGGAGAIFGSKNLKGISIKGDNKIIIKNSSLLSDAKMSIIQAVKEKKEWREMRIRYGTPADIQLLNERGLLPSYNWKTGVFDKVEALYPENLRNKYVVKDVACSPHCLTPCSKLSMVHEGEYKGYQCDGPEYETVYAFGSNCGIDRYDAIIAFNKTCDELGLDTISAGVTIGFAMECFEKDLLKKEKSDGIELRFGSPEGIIETLKKMAHKQGIGKILADGVKSASDLIGKGSEAFAMHSKGMEFGGYECRGSFGQSLQYALSSRGGCHHDLGLPARAEIADGTDLTITGKGNQIKELAKLRIVYDNAILCSFGRTVIGIEPIAKAISSIWDSEITVEDLQLASLSTINIERCFNVLTGVRRENDRLPDRLLNEKLPDGPHKGSTVPLELLKDDFYESFGWDLKNGIPKRDILINLGMFEEADKISRIQTK